MDRATYRYYIDWTDTGLYNHAYSEVSAYVLDATWRRGRPGPDEPDPAGSLTITLDNSTSLFSPSNIASPVYGLLTRDLRVKVTETIDGGSEVTQCVCLLQSIIPNVGMPTTVSTAELTAEGVIGGLGKSKVDVALQNYVGTGTAVRELLEADGVAAGDMTIATGQSTLTKWWLRKDTSTLQAIRELEIAELGRFHENRLGKYVFDSRSHIFNAPHSSPQATYGNGTLNIWNLRQLDPLQGIYDVVRGQVRTFNKSEDSVLVMITDARNGLGGQPLVVPGATDSPAAPGTLTVWFELNSKNSPANFIGVNEWGMVWVEANTSEDITGEDITNDYIDLERTSYGPRLKVVVTNRNPLPAYLVSLYARGTAIVEGDPIPIFAGEGTAEYPYQNMWGTDRVTEQAWCDYLLSIVDHRRPRLTFDVKANYDETHLAEVQTRDIGDRIRVIASLGVFGLGIDNEFIIDSISRHVDAGRIDTLTIACTLAPATQLPASAPEYDPKIVPDLAPPDDLYANAIDPAGRIVIGIIAWKYNNTVTEGEIRAKFVTGSPAEVDLRTPDEGGTLVHNPAGGMLVLTGLSAGSGGVNYQFTSSLVGRWYYAGRLKNIVGWSVWSDGNATPTNAKHFVDTQSGVGADAGPPSTSTVRAALIGGGLEVTATRPGNNGGTVLFAEAQVKDASAGPWRELDENAGAAVTYYDGSAADHVFDKTAGTLTAPSDYPAIPDDALILFDVRNSSTFSRNWCQWGTMNSTMAKGRVISQVAGFRPYAEPDTAQQWQHIRIRIVKAPWAWNTEGYLGSYPGRGEGELEFWTGGKAGDVVSKEFTFPVIQLPEYLAMGSVAVRVWFENKICRALCGEEAIGAAEESGGNPSGACALEIVTRASDPDVPAGMMYFRFSRDTVNFADIHAVAFWISAGMPADGPFAVERIANPQIIVESGTCTVVAGSENVTVTRAANAAAYGMVLAIWSDDSPSAPDFDIDGQIIKAQGLNSFTVYPFQRKTGTFNYAVIKPWWQRAEGMTDNLAYYQFKVPDEIGGNVNALQWKTPLMPLPAGHFYVTGCSVNPWGLGSRMTADSEGELIASGYCVPLAEGDIIVADCSIVRGTGKIFVITLTGDRTLRAINAVCGQIVAFRIIQGAGGHHGLILGSEFVGCDQVPAIYLSHDEGKEDLLGAMYLGAIEKFGVCAFVSGFYVP